MLLEQIEPLPRMKIMLQHIDVETLKQEFTELGVDFTKPGFYDQPEFLEAEKEDCYILDRAADFVLKQSYSEEYCNRAHAVIPALVNYLFEKISQENLIGGCLPVSMLLSRLLEEEGFFNVMFMGALTIEFKNKSMSATRFCPFRSLELSWKDQIDSAHTWICAPPFNVVDITLTLQKDVSQKESDAIGGPIATTSASSSNHVELKHLASVNFLKEFRRFKDTDLTIELLRSIPETTGWFKNIEKYGALQVENSKCSFFYVPCRITAPDGPINEMTNITLGGMSASGILQEWKALNRPVETS